MIEVVKYLENFYKGTKNPSLKAMDFFMNEYNNFEKKMKFIHIAGTNGKGSCLEILSNILVNNGYTVGKFLSPHLINYNERISINGKNISDKELSDLIEELKPKIERYNKKNQIGITLFELETTMALLYFYRNNVDFVILETGLGGLYDCTNIITKPLVSVITSIGYDHMNILGKTLPEIAYQKAGIIKENSNTVIFEQEQNLNNIFIEKCKSKKNSLYIVKKDDIRDYRFDWNFQYFTYKEMNNLKINLKGKVQVQNASICLSVFDILKKLGYAIDEKSIRKGLSTVIHKGRMEVLNNDPVIVFDGAHNEPAINNLLDMIKMYYSNNKRTYIISILKRKDYRKMLELLSRDKEGKIVLTDGNGAEDFTSTEELYESAIKYIEKDKICIKNINEAIEDAMSEDSVNFVVGSFYTYSAVVNKIKEIKNDRS